MFTVVGSLAVAVLLIIVEVPALRKKKANKELWAFSILLLFGTTLTIIQALDIQVPNPMDLIIYVYKPVSDLFDVWLK
jgi:hypothetical protein